MIVENKKNSSSEGKLTPIAIKNSTRATTSNKWVDINYSASNGFKEYLFDLFKKYNLQLNLITDMQTVCSTSIFRLSNDF